MKREKQKNPLVLPTAHARVSLLAESIHVGFVLLRGEKLQKCKDVCPGVGLCILLQQNCER